MSTSTEIAVADLMSAPITAAGFDYASLDAEAASVARAAVERIQSVHQRLLTDVIAIGDSLIKVRITVGHGNFLPWLKAEFGWTVRTAQNYMSVATRFANTQSLSCLPVTTVYRLAAAPDAVREQIVERLDAGEVIAPDKIVYAIAEARKAAKVEREEALKSPAAKAQAKAKQEQRARKFAADSARWFAERVRREDALVRATKLIRSRLTDDDLASLMDLMEVAGHLSHRDLVNAQEGGAG